MDGDKPARFPHLAWLGSWLAIGHEPRTVTVSLRQDSFCLFYIARAKAAVRWICQGKERKFGLDTGTIRIAPADGREHVYSGSCDPLHTFYTLLIPSQQLPGMLESEGIRPCSEWHSLIVHNDPTLVSCMRRIAGLTGSSHAPQASLDEVARRLLRRLAVVGGAQEPDWHDDASVFPRRMLENIVAYVDEHIQTALSLGDLALLTGLSPSHFAKKFRHSTGLSLGRFIARRRVQKSLETLKTAASPTMVALELGFSSQSHFTRVFSGLTGMTPARYQKQFRPVIG